MNQIYANRQILIYDLQNLLDLRFGLPRFGFAESRNDGKVGESSLCHTEPLGEVSIFGDS